MLRLTEINALSTDYMPGTHFLFISPTWLESSYPYNNPTKRVRDLGMMAHTCNARTGAWRQEKRVRPQALPELCSKTLSRHNKINKHQVYWCISAIPTLSTAAGEPGVHGQPWLHRLLGPA